MDLRFKHFGTFALLAIALGAAGLRFRPLRDDGEIVALAGVTLTILFWLLDRRTGKYLRAHAEQAARYARRLGGEPVVVPQWRLSSSDVTALIFLLFAIAWAAVGIAAVT